MFAPRNQTRIVTVQIRDEEQIHNALRLNSVLFIKNRSFGDRENSVPSGPRVFVGQACIADLTKQFGSLRQPRVLRLCCTNRTLFLRAPNMGRLWHTCVLSRHTHARTHVRTIYMQEYTQYVGIHRLELTFINTVS